MRNKHIQHWFENVTSNWERMNSYEQQKKKQQVLFSVGATIDKDPIKQTPTPINGRRRHRHLYRERNIIPSKWLKVFIYFVLFLSLFDHFIPKKIFVRPDKW